MQKKNKSTVLKENIFILLVTIVVLVAGSFAWFYSSGSQNFLNVEGSVQYAKYYFDGGNGTQEKPYKIANAEQLYNLAWLQYVGTFNTSEKNSDGTDTNVVNTTYFILTNDIEPTSDEMDKYGIIPPIGTQVHPFVGNFDGQGHKISGITVSNDGTDFTSDNLPELVDEFVAPNIVGLFGVVGNSNGPAGTIDSYTYDTSANEVKNVFVENIQVKTATEESLIGIAAGYVNGTVENVGIISSSVTIGEDTTESLSMTSNYSDYTLVGYCTSDYKDTVDVQTVELSKPTVRISRLDNADAGFAWGGSIDMQSLYDRIVDMRSLAQPIEYPLVQTVIYAEEGQEPEITTTDTTASVFREYHDPDHPDKGAITFSQLNASTPDGQYNFLYGADTVSYSKVVTTTIYGTDSVDAHFISDGTYFLNADENGVISVPIISGTNLVEGYSLKNDNTDDEGIESETENAKDEETKVIKDSEDETEDAKDEESEVIEEGEDETENTLDEEDEEVEIDEKIEMLALEGVDSNPGHALLAAGDDGTSVRNASKWIFSNTSKGYLYTIIDGTNYYLNSNGTELVISLDPTTYWEMQGSQIYCTDGSTTYYLVCEEGEWVLSEQRTASFYITNGNYYLNRNNGNITYTTNRNQATKWTLTISGNGYLINNGSYYLRNNNGTLALYNGNTAANRSVWTYDDYKLANNNQNVTCISGTWSLQRAQNYFLFYSRDDEYLNINENATGIMAGTEDNATHWLMDGDGYVYTFVNGRAYYVAAVNNQSLTVTETRNNATAFTYNNNRLTYRTGGFIGIGATTHYVFCNSGSWMINETNSNATRTYREEYGTSIEPLFVLPADDVSIGALVLEDTSVDVEGSNTITTSESGEYETPDTYIPITVNDDSEAGQTNTGYIISGGAYHAPGSLVASGFPYSSGDIRVSGYAITSSIGGSYSAQNGLNEVYTIDAGGLHTINNNNNSYEKYDESRSKLENVLRSGSTYVYGLHFMDATISQTNLATLPHAIINGEEYTNYQMPRDSIDFELYDSGYINFFAGNYFSYQGSTNDSFFSLNQIFRDEDDNITDIKEISKVYEVSKGIYAYQYKDGSYSDFEGSLGDMVFDMAWIGRQGTNVSNNRNRVFYFEVPANAGEYALGSVSGGTGAYLLYLDLSANAQEVLRHEVTEVKKTTTDTYEYPKGVQILHQERNLEDMDELDSVAIAIPGGSSPQTATISRLNDDETVMFTGIGTAKYKGDDITLLNTYGNKMDVLPKSTTVTKEMKITTVDYNTIKKTKSTSVTIITETDGGNRTVTKYIDGVLQDNPTYSGEITQGTSIYKYHYILPTDTTVTNLFEYKGFDDDKGFDTDNGLLEIDEDIEYPAIGAEPVEITDFTLPDHVITITTTKEIKVRLDEIAGGYAAKVNGQNFVVDGRLINVLP